MENSEDNSVAAHAVLAIIVLFLAVGLGVTVHFAQARNKRVVMFNSVCPRNGLEESMLRDAADGFQDWLDRKGIILTMENRLETCSAYLGGETDRALRHFRK